MSVPRQRITHCEVDNWWTQGRCNVVIRDFFSMAVDLRGRRGSHSTRDLGSERDRENALLRRTVSYAQGQTHVQATRRSADHNSQACLCDCDHRTCDCRCNSFRKSLVTYSTNEILKAPFFQFRQQTIMPGSPQPRTFRYIPKGSYLNWRSGVSFSPTPAHWSKLNSVDRAPARQPTA